MKTFKKALFVGILLLLVISTFALAETSPSITIMTDSIYGTEDFSSTVELDAGTYNFNASISDWVEDWAWAELWNADTNTMVESLFIWAANCYEDSDLYLAAGHYYIRLEAVSGKGQMIWCSAGVSW